MLANIINKRYSNPVNSGQTRCARSPESGLPVSLSAALLTLFAVTAATSTDARAAASDWYVGIGGGVSVLSPDTDAVALTVTEDQSTLFTAYAGRRFGRFALEAGYNDLGEVELSDGSTISYSALSLGGVYRIPLGRTRRGGEQSAVFARLGVNSMNNESELPLEEADNMALWAGGGAEWMFTPQLALRGEVASFDGDALGASVSLRWHPVAEQRRARPVLTSPPEEAPSKPRLQSRDETTTGSAPIIDPRPEPDTADRASSSQSPPLNESPAGCAIGHPAEPLDSDGCPVLSGVVAGLAFLPGQTQLQAGSDRLLDQLAQRLRAQPALLVELQSHAADARGATAAMQLTRQRVVVLARELVQRGVDLQQLRARAFGDTRPPGSSAASIGAPRDRVELQVLGVR